MTSILNTPVTLTLFALSLTVACGDDGGATTNETESPSTSAGSESTDATDATTGGSTEATSAGSSSDTADTDPGTTDPDTTDATTGDTTATTDVTGTTDATETDTDATTGDQPVCDGMGQLPAEWYLNVIDGVFPNDVPEDLDESCAVVEGEGLRLDCPSVEFEILLTATPMPALPEPGAQADVRLHHEPGWLNWPDLWITGDAVGGDSLAFQASSVLHPIQGAYAVPWAPALTQSECGPFLLEDMIGGEDPCGEQLGYELRFEVEGETVTAWHGTHALEDVAGAPFEVWVGASREYLDPPEFCDTSPKWFSLVTRRG